MVVDIEISGVQTQDNKSMEPTPKRLSVGIKSGLRRLISTVRLLES
jgi:hypothetical protein